MIEIDIPGYRMLLLRHLALDYNGTIAHDGKLLSGVKERIAALSQKLTVHVLTADTFGTAASQLERAPCTLSVLEKTSQDVGKRDYVARLGAEATVAIGNGRNDRLMLREAVLGICVVQGEGAAAEAVRDSEVVCPTILVALDLLLNPLRLIATLRS
jgi:soluble P-type ATPase